MSVTVVPNPSSQQKTQVLLLHGWGYDHRCWEPLLPVFTKLNLSTVLVDLDYTDETVTSLTTKLADSLTESAYVVGWSLGGMLAVQLATCYPDKVKGVITLAANAKFVADDGYSSAMPKVTFQQFYDAVNRVPKKGRLRFAKLQVHSAVTEDVVQWVDEHLVRFAPSLTQGLDLLAEIDNRQSLENFTSPMMALFAENDALVPASVVDQSCFSSPVILVHQIKNCGHLLQYSPETAELVEGFLGSLEEANG